MSDSESKIKNQKSKMPPGPLFIISGPSGSGKSTVLTRLLEDPEFTGRLRLSVSATTRAPRPGEMDGKHYHFWTPECFEEERRAGAFLEWAKVHDHSYGTLRREVEPYRKKGIGVLLEIDVQGAGQIRRLYADAVSIFMQTLSLQTYEERLRKRGTEDDEAIRRRLAAAQRELAYAGEYDYQIVNEDLDAAVAELRKIIRSQLKRSAHAR